MNAKRRKAITAELAKLGDVRAVLETLRDEESECMENMPDSFRDGEKGEKAQEAIDKLESIISNLEEAEGESWE